jgi:hypothetical protein
MPQRRHPGAGNGFGCHDELVLVGLLTIDSALILLLLAGPGWLPVVGWSRVVAAAPGVKE